MNINSLVEAFYEKARELNGDTQNKEDPVNYRKLKISAYRHSLESYVYLYLEEKYGKQLTEHWQTHQFPREAKYAWVIVERRCHPNWWFVLRNIAWAGPHMSLYIFCSNENIEFLKSLLGDKAANVHFIICFNGFLKRNDGIHEMNRVLTNPNFYSLIQAEYILTFQMDAYFRRKIPEVIFTGDFYGAPHGWDLESPGGGGITMRNVKRMIELCSKEDIIKLGYPEDCAIHTLLKKYEGKYPPLEFRAAVFCENFPVPDPVGVHQFWTFIENFKITEKEEFKKYIENILTIKIM